MNYKISNKLFACKQFVANSYQMQYWEWVSDFVCNYPHKYKYEPRIDDWNFSIVRERVILF